MKDIPTAFSPLGVRGGREALAPTPTQEKKDLGPQEIKEFQENP